MFKTGIVFIRCVVASLIGAMCVITVSAFSAGEQRSVVIIDGANAITVETCYETAEEILKQASISLGEQDRAVLTLGSRNGELKIDRAFTVYVTYGNLKTQTTTVTTCSVKDALATLNLALDEYDICNYKEDDILTGEAYIDIVDINCVTESYEEEIPYTTKVEYSENLEKGTTNTKNAGSNGVKTVTVQKIYENGVLVSSKVISEQTVENAVAQQKVVGTKTAKTSANTPCISTLVPDAPIALNAAGVPLNYTKRLTFEATAYTSSSGARCSTGVQPQPGRVAVNPNVIPYGTKMYIVSADGKYHYGYAIASDTGGFAKKNPYAVDLYMSTRSACLDFGRRNVQIYILE